MFEIFQSGFDKHLIDQGRVSCPIRGRDIEFDLCIGCRSLLEIDETADLPFVRCRPQSVRVPLTQMGL